MKQTVEKIPVRYVGLQKVWRDYLYKSGVTFEQNKVSPVNPWSAAQLLKHPEFEDARKEGKRGTPIIGEQPEEVAVDDDIQESVDSIHLENMTKDQMTAYAMRTFGVHVDPSALKADLTDSVRHLARSRGFS